ncbi:MAG TPA: hypothetical protein VIK45_04755 [Candidatus Dormibacteraeota bacterium]
MTTSQLQILAAGLLVAAVLWLLTVWRPAIGCALLVLGIPLTGGLSRGSVVPLLRVNEVLLLIVVTALIARALPRRHNVTFTGLDLPVLAFCLGGVVIPWAVISLQHADASLDDWRSVLAPIQYLLIYVVFSRVRFSERDLRLLLNLTMLASVIVAVVALVEVANLPGVRRTVETLFPPLSVEPVTDTSFRPTSLLGHFSAVGAFGVMNLALALALAAARTRDFNGIWLGIVMALNGVTVIATQTLAPIVVLPLAAVLVLIHLRHVPWQVGFAPVALLAGLVALWPSVQARIQNQLAAGSPAPGVSQGRLPASLQVRVGYWQDYFLPSLLNHGPWLGTGTLIPSDVPRRLIQFVDNGYLWAGFRAGLVGVLLMVVLLAAIAGVAWSLRSSGVAVHRAIGATAFASVIAFALMELTSEYLTFTSVTQEFWMLVGLAAAATAQRRRSPIRYLVLSGRGRDLRGRRLPV